MTTMNENKKKKIDLEERLLSLLQNSKGNLVDDDSVVGVLNDTKKTTDEVNAALATA